MKSKIGDFNTPSGQGERADVVMVDGKAYGANEIRALLANQLPKGYVTVPLEIWEVMCEHERERDALAAKLAKITAEWLAAGSWPDTSEEVGAISAAINSSPDECLRELQAEAGRAGYLKGADDWNSFGHIWDADIRVSADEYAATVRQDEQTGTWLKDANVNGGKRQGGE